MRWVLEFVFTMPCFPNYYLGVDSGSICDTIQAIDELKDEQKTFQVRVFPSPAKSSDQLSILFTNLLSLGGIIKIFNSNSQLVYTQSLSQWSSICKVNLPILKEGIYLVQLTSGKRKGQCKFVITN